MQPISHLHDIAYIDGPPITIYYAQNNEEVYFKIKRSTALKKLMQAYCERQGKTLNSVRFLYDGARIRPENTPDEVGAWTVATACTHRHRLTHIYFFLFLFAPPMQLEMENGDAIDVMVEQIGGAGRL